MRTNKDSAFAWLTDCYAQKIYGSCLQLLRNEEDAEDLVQEVFVAIYLSIETFSGNSKLSTWIYALTHNKGKEFLRSKTRLKRQGIHTSVDEKEIGKAVNTVNFNHPGVQLEDKEHAKILFDAIDALAENQARAFRLAKLEGYSYTEIGEIMELSVSSVESLLFRANKRLRELLSEFYQENIR